MTENSSAGVVVLVTFRYGAAFGTVRRYTSSPDALVVAEQTFEAEPSIEVTMNAQAGGSADNPVQVRMAIREPLEALTSQRAHGPVRVDIEEMDPADASTRATLFAGVIRKSARNRGGQAGIVELEIAGWKYSLEVPANAWLADTTCNNVFGDEVCGAALEDLAQTGTITDITGNLVTLSGLDSPESDWFQFGYLAFDGLQIKVRAQISGTQLMLLKTPPATWNGATVTAVPGCDKRLATCRNRWSREAHFTGFGLKIPAYNPMLESL